MGNLTTLLRVELARLAREAEQATTDAILHPSNANLDRATQARVESQAAEAALAQYERDHAALDAVREWLRRTAEEYLTCEARARAGKWRNQWPKHSLVLIANAGRVAHGSPGFDSGTCHGSGIGFAVDDTEYHADPADALLAAAKAGGDDASA